MTEEKEENKIEKEESKEKKTTLQDRVSKLIKEFEIEDPENEFKKAVIELVERAMYPQYFCPECDEKMFYDPTKGGFSCLNCGYVSKKNPVARSIPSNPPQGQSPEGNQEMPEEVRNMLDDAEGQPRRRKAPSGQGAKIRELVDKMDGVQSQPTSMDEQRIKNTDPNVKDINWV